MTDKKTLVVGGGVVALRKVETLLEFGSNVVVVSPEVSPGLRSLAEYGKIEIKLKSYSREDLEGIILAIAATDDRGVNTQVSEDARAAGILVNVVDDPELCSFIVPAVVRRKDLTISVATGGKSPALARRVKEMIEVTIGPEYGELADILGEIRHIAKERIESQPEREKAFSRIIESKVLDLIRQGYHDEARALAIRILEQFIDLNVTE